MQLDQQVLEALEQGLLSVAEAAEALSTLLSNYDEEARANILERLANLGMPQHSAEPDLVEYWRWEPRAPARERLLQRLRMQDATLLELHDRRLQGSNLNLSRLRQSDAVILLVQPGSVTVPEFQFQMQDDAAVPRLSVRRCNASLLAGADPWGALSWWISSNGYLASRAPLALLGTDDEEQLAALAESMTATA